MYACNVRVKYIHVMCARYNIKTYTYNVCEGVPPAPLPPAETRFCPHSPLLQNPKRVFHRFQILTV